MAPTVGSPRALALLALGAALAVAVGCSGASSSTPDRAVGGTAAPASVAAPASRLVEPAAFRDALAATPRPLVVNVHVPYEGHIDGTDRFIDYQTITDHLGELPADRRAPIALYCRSGHMSAIAATALRAAGFTDIVELRGGMQAWEAAGLPLRRDLRP